MEIVHEEWRPVVGKFAGAKYEISNLGRLRSTNTYRPGYYHRILKPAMGNAGYMIRSLFINGKNVTSNIHILVAEAFVGVRPPGMQVNHKDGNKTNNLPENLEWVTRQEQQYHAIRLGLKVVKSGPRPALQGSRNPMAKWTEDDIREMRRQFKSGIGRQVLAKRYGTSPERISRIVHGHAWKHVASA